MTAYDILTSILCGAAGAALGVLVFYPDVAWHYAKRFAAWWRS